MVERVITSRIVYQCPVFSVEHAVVELPDGQRADRWYATKDDVVGVVAVDDSGRLLLTREYRSASREVRWRIPMGRIKRDEAPEQAARRELREEAGYDASVLTHLFTHRRPSGWIKEVSHFFFAYGLVEAPAESGEPEQIEIYRLLPEELRFKGISREVSPDIALALDRALALLKEVN